MSDDTEPSQSIFAAYRKYVLLGITTVVAASLLIVAIVKDWLPNLFAVFGNWLVLSILSFGLFVLILVYLYYTYSTNGQREWPWGASPDEQLSKAEARELTEWALFNEEPPIKPGQYHRNGVKSVTDQDDGSSTRIYDAIFDERNSTQTYAVVVNLDDSVEFEIDWIENMTEETMQKANDAVQELNDWEVLQKKQAESMAAFEDRVEESREQIGRSRRSQKTVKHYDDGDLDKVETIDVRSISSDEV